MSHELSAGVRLRSASPVDRVAIERLMLASGLTVGDERTTTGQLFVAEVEGAVVGMVGLERFGSDALMRATCVATEWRERGVGSALVEHALTQAALHAVDSVYLLAGSAAGFFARFGFAPVEESRLPLPVSRSVARGGPRRPGTVVMELRLAES